MFSKPEIEKSLVEDGTPERSLENAKTIMFGGGYECDGIRVFRNQNMTPKWTVFAHFTHGMYHDVISIRFQGFNLDDVKGQKAMSDFFKMFNIHPHFNPFQPRSGYEWGCYCAYGNRDDRQTERK